MTLELTNITIVVLACAYIDKTAQALEYGMRDVEFARAFLARHKKLTPV